MTALEVMRSVRIVESGPADDVYEHPSHPYTQALLASGPVPDPRAMRTRRAERERLLAADSPEPD
jgi:oligopeptide/dipeptide ABC transporter ATP-binding protein